MSRGSRRVEKEAAAQREQAEALQARINAGQEEERLRYAQWEVAKTQYLLTGDTNALKGQADVFYSGELFLGLPAITTRIAVEISTLAAERAVRVMTEYLAPKIAVGPGAIDMYPELAAGGFVKRSAVLPLLGDTTHHAPRSYGEPTTLDAELEALLAQPPLDPDTIPEPDCE